MSFSKTQRRSIAIICMLSPLLCAAQKTKLNYVTFAVPGAESTIPISVNNSMTVTGSYLTRGGGSAEGFVRNAIGDITTFVVPESLQTNPVSINAAGEIAGSSLDYSANSFGFVRYPNGSIATFSPGGGHPGITYVQGINNAGTIVGSYAAAIGLPPIHGYIRCASGEITTFDVPGSDRTQPALINDAGEVAGIYSSNNYAHQGAFIRSADGKITTFPGTPAGINAEGSIVGWLGGGASGQPFVRSPSGAIDRLDGVPAPLVYPYMGINETDSIFYNLRSDQQPLVTGNGFLLQLADGTQTIFQIPGSFITIATSINDCDVITGYYTNLQGYTGFLWMPKADQPQ